MRRIRKGPEPKSWAGYRLSTPGASYEDAPKEGLRDALLAEQGYVCCYCMQRIDKGTTRIEHRLPREKHKELQFSYANLLAACTGGEGLDPALQHCDVRKHNTEITLDPAHPTRNVEDLVQYSYASGAMDSTDESAHRDLQVTLNLNLDWIKRARLAVLDGFRKGFEQRHKNTWSADIIERELKKWDEIPPGGRLTPYSAIVVSYLRKRLQRAHREK